MTDILHVNITSPKNKRLSSKQTDQINNQINVMADTTTACPKLNCKRCGVTSSANGISTIILRCLHRHCADTICLKCSASHEEEQHKSILCDGCNTVTRPLDCQECRCGYTFCYRWSICYREHVKTCVFHALRRHDSNSPLTINYFELTDDTDKFSVLDKVGTVVAN